MNEFKFLRGEFGLGVSKDAEPNKVGNVTDDRMTGSLLRPEADAG